MELKVSASKKRHLLDFCKYLLTYPRIRKIKNQFSTV